MWSVVVEGDAGAGVRGGRAAALAGGAHEGAGGSLPRAEVPGAFGPT